MFFDAIVYGVPKGSYFMLLLAPIAAVIVYEYYCRERDLKAFADKDSLKKIAVLPERRLRLFRAIALCVVWVSAVLAFMDPRGNIQYLNADDDDVNIIAEASFEDVDDDVSVTISRRRKAHDVIFLLDASASMSVADMRTGTSRLDYAKDIIDECCTMLRGQSVSLYAFTSEVTTLVPPTVDTLFFRLMLKKASINEGDVAGTDILEALDTVKEKHLQRGVDKARTLIIVTDGGDTRLEGLSGSARKTEMLAITQCLRGAEDLNLRTFCIGVGSHSGDIIPDITLDGNTVRSSLDEGLLRALSDEGRGRYYFANDASPLIIAEDIIGTIENDSPYIEEESSYAVTNAVMRSVEKNAEIYYDLYYQTPLAFAIVALTYYLFATAIHRKRRVL